MAREAPHFRARVSYPSFGDVRVCHDGRKTSGRDGRHEGMHGHREYLRSKISTMMTLPSSGRTFVTTV